MQHLIRWVIAHGARACGHDARDEAWRCCSRCSTPRSAPSWSRPARTARCSRPKTRSARTRCTTSPSSTSCATGMRPSKIAFLAARAWRDADAGAWPPGFPDDEHYAYDLPTIVRWLRVFLRRYFAFAQFKRSAIPNGPKVSPGGLPLAARRLARAVGRQRARMARRTACRAAGGRLSPRLGSVLGEAAVREGDEPGIPGQVLDAVVHLAVGHPALLEGVSSRTCSGCTRSPRPSAARTA